MYTTDTLEPIVYRQVLEFGYEDPEPEHAPLPTPDLDRIPPVAVLAELLRAIEDQTDQIGAA